MRKEGIKKCLSSDTEARQFLCSEFKLASKGLKFKVIEIDSNAFSNTLYIISFLRKKKHLSTQCTISQNIMCTC